MNVNIGTQWEEFISVRVRSGRYLSASEVVREALRLLQEREQLRQAHLTQLRDAIEKGVKQVDRGEYAEFDAAGLKDHLERVKARGRERLAKGKTAVES